MADLQTTLSREQAQIGAPTPRVSAAEIGGSVFGEGLTMLATKYDEKLQEDENLEAARLEKEQEAAWTQEQIRRRENAEAGAPNYTETMMADYDKQAASIMDKYAGSARMQAKVRQRLGDVRQKLIVDSMSFEAKARSDYRKTTALELINHQRNMLTANPAGFQKALEKTMADLEGIGLKGQELMDMRLMAKQGLSASSVAALEQKNPYEAKKLLSSGKMDDYLDADAKLTLMNRADSSIKTLENQRKQERILAQQDALRFLQVGDGGKIADPLTGALKMSRLQGKSLMDVVDPKRIDYTKAIEYQRSIGVPDSQLAVMRKEEAALIVGKLKDSADETEFAQNVAAIKQQYGQYGDMAIKNLVELGGADPTIKHAVVMAESGKGDVLRATFQAARDNPKALDEAFKARLAISGSMKESDFEADVVSNLEGFSQAFAGGGYSTQDYADILNTTKTAAKQMVADGIPPKEAAKRAATWLNDRFHYEDTYAIPKTRVTDPAAAAGYLESSRKEVLAALPEDALTPPIDGATGEPMNKSVYQQQLRDASYWKTNSTMDGVSLFFMGRQVIGKNGKPVQKTWDEIQAEQDKKLKDMKDGKASGISVQTGVPMGGQTIVIKP